LQSLYAWISNLDNQHEIIVAFIDFAKVVMVSIIKLVHNLSHINITGNLFSCIRSILTNRRQLVKNNNSFAEYQAVTSGVPQRNSLGPVLLIIFTNDLIDTTAPNIGKIVCRRFEIVHAPYWQQRSTKFSKRFTCRCAFFMVQSLATTNICWKI